MGECVLPGGGLRRLLLRPRPFSTRSPLAACRVHKLAPDCARSVSRAFTQSEFKVACRSVLTKLQKTDISKKVRQDYRVHMIMDNLPAATKMIAEMPDGTKKDMCAPPLTLTPHP
jgi:hypothetical protein